MLVSAQSSRAIRKVQLCLRHGGYKSLIELVLCEKSATFFLLFFLRVSKKTSNNKILIPKLGIKFLLT